MKLTNEEIKKILDGAPDGATHYAEGMHYLAYNSSGNWMRYDKHGIGSFCWFDANDFKFSYTKSFHNLADLREILEIRQEVERLQAKITEMSELCLTNKEVWEIQAKTIEDAVKSVSKVYGEGLVDSYELLQYANQLREHGDD